MGLNTWNKQSFACLSSRFVYGETISKEKLSMVDKAEQPFAGLRFFSGESPHPWYNSQDRSAPGPDCPAYY